MVMASISFQPILHHDEDYGDLLKGIEMILHTHVPNPSPKHHILSKMSLTVSQVCIPLSQYILNQGASME